VSRAKPANFGEGEQGLTFLCPGCGSHHSVRVGAADGRPVWGWNGSYETPTLTPSVLVREGHYARDGEQPGNCYCDFAERYPEQPPMKWKCGRCHSFVTDGRIQFLGDCTHALAGQTVDLPELAEVTS
jgi:hypothetical protein